MARVGEPPESYHDSRLRERRLQAYPHWDEIQVRLQHRWAVDRVVRWHQEKFPGAPCPSRMTLYRYLKTKGQGWFISRLILAESGMQTAQSQLVSERQSEMIETMVMRLAAGREFERAMNGLLVPEVTKNFDLLDRMLLNHFRVRQEMGLEPKHGSMAPTGSPAAESGTEKLVIQRIVELPHEQFMELMHKHFADRWAKGPLLPGEVIDVEARVTKAAPAD
jgi:hypothetical protein